MAWWQRQSRRGMLMPVIIYKTTWVWRKECQFIANLLKNENILFSKKEVVERLTRVVCGSEF